MGFLKASSSLTSSGGGLRSGSWRVFQVWIYGPTMFENSEQNKSLIQLSNLLAGPRLWAQLHLGGLPLGQLTKEQVYSLWCSHGQEGGSSQKTITATPGPKGPDIL